MTTHHDMSRSRRRCAPTLMRPSLLPLLLALLQITALAAQDFEPTCPDNFSGHRPGPACESYYVCDNGAVVSPVSQCPGGTIFNEWLNVCDFAANFECGSTRRPTARPTHKPTHSPTARIAPTTPSPTFPPQTRAPSANAAIEDALEFARQDMDRKLFIYQHNWGEWLPSTQYRFDGFLKGLRLMYLEGVGDLSFYMGEDLPGEEGTKVGLVNIAAFLAQSMKETIKYDACDENNWDVVDNQYPLSNACGQLEQSYQDYQCPEGMEHMQCDVDPDMEITATTQAKWYGAPGPLFCGPKSKYPFTGHWDYHHECDFSWEDPPRYCEDYPGQKGGRAVNDEPVANANGRTDVEGCCWWGRGVIQTTGVCNFGMLNYYLGARAAAEGRESKYPEIDFCKDPGAVCTRDAELKWIAGMFYWIRSLQTYDDGWNYKDNLKAFVRGGMEGNLFIDSVSGIVNRGCHNPPCGTGPLDGGYERQENFKKVLKVLFEPDGSPRKFRENVSYSPTASAVDSGPRPDWPGPPRPGPWGEAPVARFDEEEEEDWSEVDADEAGSVSMWCGKDRFEAFENCGRNGYDCPDGYCVNGLKCFKTDSCDGEDDEGDDASNASMESPANVATQTEPETAIVNNIGLRNNYCAKSMAALETECVTAQTCSAAGQCPAGTYCWGEHLCGGTTLAPSSKDVPNSMPTYMPTYDTYMPTTPSASEANGQSNQQQSQPPDSASAQFDVTETFFCGTDRTTASTSCHKRCPGGSDEECDGDESCFGYTSCEAEIPREPGPAEPEPLATPKPTPLPTPDTPVVEPEAAANAGPQLYCAATMSDLVGSCASAQSCASDPCPSGLFCFPFTCTASAGQAQETPANTDSEPATAEQPVPVENPQPAPAESGQSTPAGRPQQFLELCPELMASFEGWHATADCKEYYQCDELGVPGVIHACGSGLKFDKVQNECRAEGSVNEFCYGAAIGDEETQQPQQSQQQQSGPGLGTAMSMCPSGYTGWQARQGCKEYYYCQNGVADVVYTCSTNLLFDRTMELCNFAYMVSTQCAPVTAPPVPPPTPPPTPWPTVSTSPSSDSESPSSGPPGSDGNGGVVGDYAWSETARPTVPADNSEIPPWLKWTKNGGAGHVKIRALLFWMPIQIAIMQWC
ncbi:hypothetical protein ACHAXT_002611 [Thalassiosira profunda]